MIKKVVNSKSGVSEARLLASLKHPHMAHVYGTSTNGRVFIIVMEYLAGGCLKDRLAGVPPWQESLPAAREICDGLSFLHKNPMIHGNLRPANILITADGDAKLSDIFSAGMIFSEMLTGSIPVEKKGHLIQNDAFRFLPMELRKMIAKTLAPDPADRYGSFDEILPGTAPQRRIVIGVGRIDVCHLPAFPTPIRSPFPLLR